MIDGSIHMNEKEKRNMTTDLPTEEIVNAVISAIPTNLPLQEQIDMQLTQAAKYLPEEVAKQLNSHLEYLVTSSIAENALKENELAPDFTLPDALGQQVTLSRLLEQGPVVLVFYRGGWCPYCNMALRAYQKVLSEFKALGATLVAISPMLPDHTLSTVEKQQLTFPVLSDVGNQVARQFGLVFKMDEIGRSLYQQGGADLLKYNGDDSWELPIPGTFLIDQSRKLRLASVDANFFHRLDPSFVIARMKELKGETE
jgi:peroxiredoxin